MRNREQKREREKEISHITKKLVHILDISPGPRPSIIINITLAFWLYFPASLPPCLLRYRTIDPQQIFADIILLKWAIFFIWPESLEYIWFRSKTMLGIYQFILPIPMKWHPKIVEITSFLLAALLPISRTISVISQSRLNAMAFLGNVYQRWKLSV